MCRACPEVNHQAEQHDDRSDEAELEHTFLQQPASKVGAVEGGGRQVMVTIGRPADVIGEFIQ